MTKGKPAHTGPPPNWVEVTVVGDIPGHVELVIDALVDIGGEQVLPVITLPPTVGLTVKLPRSSLVILAELIEDRASLARMEASDLRDLTTERAMEAPPIGDTEWQD